MNETANETQDFNPDYDYLVPKNTIYKELGISRATGWRWEQDGVLPKVISIQSKHGFSRKAIEAWKKEHGFVVNEKVVA